MVTFSQFDTATGAFTGHAVRGFRPKDADGCAWIEGRFDQRTQRIDLNTLTIVACEPACFGDSIPPGVLQWFDTAVKPRAGDYVLIYQRNGDRIEALCKKLLEIEGELWACCHFFIIPIAWLQNVVAVATLVCEVRFPGAHFTHIRHQIRGSDAEEAAWRRELNSHPKVQRATAKLRTFTTEGFIDGKRRNS